MKKVLVLERSLTVRMDVARILAAQGCLVRTCGDAGEARAALADGGIDLLVLDIAPESGGLTIAEEQRRDGGRAPVLFLVGDGEAAAAAAWGAQPQVRKPYSEAGIIVAAQDAMARRSAKPRALVVDDSVTFLALMSESLRDSLDVHAVESGEQALAYLAEHVVDVILLDRALPGLSGEEVCRAIRADPRTRGLPILILTGSETNDAMVSCLDAGADDFVTKSPDLRVLTSRVRSQLRRREDDVQAALTRAARADAAAAQVLADTRAGLLADVQRQNASLERALAEQRVAEDALRLSEEFNRTVLTSIPDCVKVLDAAGRVLSMSENCLRLMGIDDFETRRNADWTGFWEGEDRLAATAALVQARETGLGRFQGFYTTPRGDRRCWDVRIAPVRAADGGVLQFIAVARDVTEQKADQETLVRQRIELEHSNDDLKHFASVAAHDLKEPLRMVSGYLSLIERKYADGDDKVRGYLGFARDGAERMSSMLDGLLAYSHIATGQLKPLPTEAAPAFDEAVTNLTQSIAEAGAEVSSEGLPLVLANHALMVQLFQNLIANAIKFCDGRKPEVRVTAAILNGAATFRVSDNGIGIEPDQHQRIFAMFNRLHTRDEFSGSGIGLATCKRIVERNGGRIWVESAPGTGSTFCFTLATPSGADPERGLRELPAAAR